MERTVHAVLASCLKGAFDGTLTFPQELERLGAIGVERYYADLVRIEKSYYFASGESASEHLPFDDVPPIATQFSVDAIQGALRAVQQGAIDYATFLRRIMRGGVACYLVFLTGRQALYIGRHGEQYVERFPGAD